MDIQPHSIQEVQEAVKEASRLLPRGSGTKSALSTPAEGVESLEMAGLAGMLEYEPDEYTFTALAGTRLKEVNRRLAENGQYLPFDPPLVEQGATLGGTVAAGVSGPGRYHFGGVRDFLMGVKFVDSEGRLVRGGGKVVKNSAGFDLPKMMVGSCGSLGVMVELSFKVFPRPESTATLRLECVDLDEAMQALSRAASSRLDLDALDLEVARGGLILWVRLGGLQEALPARLERLTDALGSGQVLQGADEEQIWRSVGEASWVPTGWCWICLPITPSRIPLLEASLAGKPVLRRYLAGGQAAWLALPDQPQSLEGLLETQGLQGLVLMGSAGKPRLGHFPAQPFYRRVKGALDPMRRFVEL
ncbi:MAG: FAD-binding protein [Anaerolineales bacterium]|nr:FAD-binding protein [Anaerolineales bacterium]